jgi:hypothetical protein
MKGTTSVALRQVAEYIGGIGIVLLLFVAFGLYARACDRL